jgi:hypothetical protein
MAYSTLIAHFGSLPQEPLAVVPSTSRSPGKRALQVWRGAQENVVEAIVAGIVDRAERQYSRHYSSSLRSTMTLPQHLQVHCKES